MSYKLNAMYFSATGTTEKVVCGIAKKLWKNIGLKEGKEHINIMDFTLPQERQKTIEFSKDDILIIGVPVYSKQKKSSAPLHPFFVTTPADCA